MKRLVGGSVTWALDKLRCVAKARSFCFTIGTLRYWRIDHINRVKAQFCVVVHCCSFAESVRQPWLNQCRWNSLSQLLAQMRFAEMRISTNACVQAIFSRQEPTDLLPWVPAYRHKTTRSFVVRISQRTSYLKTRISQQTILPCSSRRNCPSNPNGSVPRLVYRSVRLCIV